jgi:hypothetical protein
MEFKNVEVTHKCGHVILSKLIVGKLAESITYRQQTRCVDCFERKSLLPANLEIAINDRVWIDCRAFGFIFEPLVEAIVISIHADRILVRLTNPNVLMDDPSPHQLVDLKYISLQP